MTTTPGAIGPAAEPPTGSTHSGPRSDPAQDRAGVTAALDRIRAAWDAGDAPAYAAEFTEDASYVIFTGLVHRGRDEIRQGHVPVFDTWQRGSRMAMEVLDLRFLGPDTAVVLTRGGLGTGRRTPRTDKVQTFVMVREPDGRWRCAAFQNTRKNRLFLAMNRLASQRGGHRDR